MNSKRKTQNIRCYYNRCCFLENLLGIYLFNTLIFRPTKITMRKQLPKDFNWLLMGYI